MGNADCLHFLPPITDKIKKKYVHIHVSNMFINMKSFWSPTLQKQSMGRQA